MEFRLAFEQVGPPDQQQDQQDDPQKDQPGRQGGKAATDTPVLAGPWLRLQRGAELEIDRLVRSLSEAGLCGGARCDWPRPWQKRQAA